MLTIGSSSVTHTSSEPELSEAVAKNPRKRVPLMTIPVTLAVGLLLGAGYVGYRVIASRHAQVVIVSAPASVPTAPTSPAAEAAPAGTPEVQEVKEKSLAESHAIPPIEPAPIAPNAAKNETGDLIAPQHGERYLQIAAISASAAQKFISGLSRYNLEANVAPGPHDGLVRVVIGPFPDRESAASIKAQIQTTWPDCFVRLY